MIRTDPRLVITLCILAGAPSFAQNTPRPPPGGQFQPGLRPQVRPQLQQQVRPAPTAPANTPAANRQGGTAQVTVTPGGAGDVEARQKNCEQVRRHAKFNIYFDKVEIEKLVQTVSDATCKTFILPENVRGKISIIGPENGKVEVNADQFYRAFLAALDANGLAVYQQGQFVKIVDKRNAKQNPIPTIVDPNGEYTTAEQMVTKIFKVKYVDVEPLRGVLQQLVSQNGDTIPFPPDVIIINDVGSNMHRLERIIDQLDSRSSSEEMRVIQINYATAQDVADKIQKLFGSQQAGGQAGARSRNPRGAITTPPAPGLSAARPQGRTEPAAATNTGGESGTVSVSQIIPDERTNKLIIIASPAGFDRINELVRMIDVPIAGEGRINVYYLENADAEEMASTLSSLASGSSNRPARPNVPAAAAAGARQPAQAAELFSGEVKISADKATNSLVVIASQADYRSLVKVIEKLDVQRKQVFVEAVIMEVNVQRNDTFGARLHTGYGLNTSDGTLPVVIGTKFGQESLPPSFSVASLASFGGFLAGLQGPSIPGIADTLGFNIPAFGVLIHALADSSDVNVLSTPHILTTDNEEAEITVGQNVPFQAGVAPGALSSLAGLGGTSGVNPTSALTSSLFGSFVTPINRQNVELKLTVKPQINESDYIRLVINEQTEEIASTDPVLGPTTSKRTAKTTIVARDQETVVIGGIMQDRTIEGVNKVPVLGDIPLIGHLFREQSNKKVKTNLLLFLTPYIIKDQSDFRRIFERKMKERQQFVETFYGQLPGYEVAIDWDRKKGPLGAIEETIYKERQKVENGGPGQPGERVIAPGPVSGPYTAPSSEEGAPTEAAPGGEQPGQPGGATEAPAPEGTPPGGEVAPAPEGSEPAPAPEVTPEGEGRPEEQLRLPPAGETQEQ